MKFAKATLLLFSAVSVFAGDIDSLRPGQPEVYGSLSINRFSSSLTKAGVSMDGGVTLHPYFTVIGEYNLTPLGGGSLRYFDTTAKGSVRYHSLQGGGRFNMIRHGRVIPFALATAGLLRVGASASVHSLFLDYSDGGSHNVFGFGVGGGVIVRCTNHFDTKLEFKGCKPQDGSWFPAATIGAGIRF